MLGLSHPHDGYDPSSGLDFQSVGPFKFARIGDESSTVMGYNQIENDFGQFDLDTSNRLLTAAYINEANSILGRIAASPRAGQVAGAVHDADSSAANALNAHAASNWAGAVLLAKDAYDRVLAAAEQINVHIEPEARIADYQSSGQSYAFTDSAKDLRLDDVDAEPPLP
jgi:hypothetical protein